MRRSKILLGALAVVTGLLIGAGIPKEAAAARAAIRVKAKNATNVITATEIVDEQ